MKKAIILVLTLLITASVSAQFMGQRQNRFNRQPQAPPSESQKEAAEKRALERRQEFVVNFLSTLEADEFQKEIAKQAIDDYFVKITEFTKILFGSSAERKDAFDMFKREHFRELKSLMSDSDNKKLDEFLNGDFEENEVKKKRRKNRKRKKDNDDN